MLHLIDISEEDLIGVYKKIKFELSTYDKELIKKKEIIFFNKSDLLNSEEINKKLSEFKKKLNVIMKLSQYFQIEILKKLKNYL